MGEVLRRPKVTPGSGGRVETRRSARTSSDRGVELEGCARGRRQRSLVGREPVSGVSPHLFGGRALFREMLTRLRFPGAVSRKRRELNSRTRAASQSRISLARVGFQIGHPSPALPPRRSQTVERASRARAHSAEVEMAPSAEEHDPELKVEFRRELRKGFRDLRSDARGAPRAMRPTPFFLAARSSPALAERMRWHPP